MINPLILALDVDAKDAKKIIEELKSSVEIFKIGGRLFTEIGPPIVREIQSQKRKVFLDLKFHDIPLTVAESCRNATRLGVWGLTIHVSGGFDMMKLAAETVQEESIKLGVKTPLIFGVTVLTSLSADDLREVGIARSPLKQVQRLALLAKKSGIDGVVASPNEIAAIRKVCQQNLLVMTPGIRSQKESGKDDQKRVMSAGQAMAAGANYLVVGRPILGAKNRAAAAQEFLKEIHQAHWQHGKKNGRKK